jgi:thiol-disulfide isomerase/thioredoxin
MATRYLDSDEFLPVIRTAWSDAGTKGHAEIFLRNAVERSTNPRMKALACFSLGRHQQQLARLARYLDNPIRNKALAEYLGPENVRRIRSVKPEYLNREAEALFERTIREFADAQPMGQVFPRLGEQAEGALYRLRNLEIGCKAPELEVEDVDGKPMKLSDFRGQVVALSFWATWCGPCMGMIPDEKALVERMKGRPFMLLGINGDEDRARAREAQAKEGITWRSFWGGGPYGHIPLKWGISSWPTVFVVDAEGIIRDDNVRGAIMDRTFEALVAEAEASTNRPKTSDVEKPR